MRLNPSRRITRRRVLQVAGGASLGLHLGGLLQAQAAVETHVKANPKIRACILVFFYGGPSHLDTYDMKPDAPAEVRGEFQSIETSVPGLRICEHLPRMARLMHKVALIRSVHHLNRLHDSASTEILTGRLPPNGDREEFAPIKQVFPCHGATLSHAWRERNIAVPHAVLPFIFHNVIDVPCQGGGFLGTAYDPLQITVDVKTRSYQAGALAFPEQLDSPRMQFRRGLLASLDAGERKQPVAAVRQWRRYCEKAFNILASDALRNALDVSRENAGTRERYGFWPAPATMGEGGGGGNGAELATAREMRGQNLLLARRLVEAGIPFVNVNDFRQQGQNWDAHFKCFNQHKTFLLPAADQGLSALIEDLDERGLLDSTLVVALGEFGRTPQINRDGGRDHWPDCYTILMAGGGVRGGMIYGSSDRLGAYPATDPVTPADVAATIYSRFGLDPKMEIHDQTGRPFRIAEGEAVPVFG